MERALPPPSENGSGGAWPLLGEQPQPDPRLVGIGRVQLEDPGLEFLEQRLAAAKPHARLFAVGRAEPVTLLDAVEPGADLVELHPYLLRLLIRVVAAEVLELDLLHKVDLTVLDDLAVVLGGLLDEEREQLRLLLRRELAQRQQVIAATPEIDPLEHRRELS